MKTPICDFVRRYADSGAVRLHMPGHKGVGDAEKLDITEINGADSLYEAEGIIAESEANASELFGCKTYYSTEGSSQCIRAMLFLAVRNAEKCGKSATVIAARNVHKTFLSAAALVDFRVQWLYPSNEQSYLSCSIDCNELEELLIASNACAVYVTSPDYLGNKANIKAIGDVCRRYGAKLLVDNAHGAYLKFLEPSQHPMDLGAYMCCDSAHKTLPVLTGGAYLHTGDDLSADEVKNALGIFGSTSPSYLILQSLDNANAYISDGFSHKLCELCEKTETLKQRLTELGYSLSGQEMLKITLNAKDYGYLGTEIADHLRESRIECEFSDPDYTVFMLSCRNTDEDMERLYEALKSLCKRKPIPERAPAVNMAKSEMSIRDAMFSHCESIPVSESKGRVLACASVGCPPAVPILVCGDRIDESAIKAFEYYGIDNCMVVKK